MIIGQTLLAGTYLSPWFPRQGDSAVFSAEVIAIGSSASLQVGIQTKNSEETDSPPTGANSGTLGTTNSMTATGVGTVSVTGMKELVRFFYLVGATNWVHFRVLPPSWRNNGA
jgi:hypothetical protein